MAEEEKTRKAAAKVERKRLRVEEARLNAEAPTAERQAREAEKARVAAQAAVTAEEIRERLATRRASGKECDVYPMIVGNVKRNVRAVGAEIAAERDYIARTGRDGTITREYLPPPREATEPTRAEPVDPPPKADAWFYGCGRPFTAADARARHTQTEVPIVIPRNTGVREGGDPLYGNGAGEHWAGNGVRESTGEVSTLWNGKLEGL